MNKLFPIVFGFIILIIISISWYNSQSKNEVSPKEEALIKSEVDKLVNGEFKVPSFSEKTFREQLRRLEIEDPIQAAKVELEIDQALESMREVTSDLRGTSLEDTRESVDRAINLTLFPFFAKTT